MRQELPRGVDGGTHRGWGLAQRSGVGMKKPLVGFRPINGQEAMNGRSQNGSHPLWAPPRWSLATNTPLLTVSHDYQGRKAGVAYAEGPVDGEAFEGPPAVLEQKVDRCLLSLESEVSIGEHFTRRGRFTAQ